jgi:hypothetical protein
VQRGLLTKTDGPLKRKGGLQRWRHKEKPVGNGGSPLAKLQTD